MEKELITSTVTELKEMASELGIEKLSGMEKAKLISAIKRKITAIEKKKELVKQLKKTEEVKSLKVVRVKISAPKDFNPSDWNILGKEELKLPIFENKQILSILKDGHNATHLHCEMEGGVRMHVPRKRLQGHGEGL